MKNHVLLFALILAPVLLLSNAGASEPASATQSARSSAKAPSKAAASPVASKKLPVALVHKSPTCGCCEVWVNHLKQNGFRVDVRNHDNLNPIKERLGGPYGKGSCHTAEIGGYVIEGHVPASDIKRLLAEKPDAKGLVLPGMPIGSPGMEVAGAPVRPYTVELVKRDGSTAGYSTHGK